MFSIHTLLSVFLVAFSALAAAADPTWGPVLPPSWPLAVRSPYLSAWLPGDASADLTTTRARHWAGAKLIWTVFARVGDNKYALFGVEDMPDGVKKAEVLGGDYTSTHTYFELKAGDAAFTLDFFSPVSPRNYLRQSLPFSYLSISAKSTGNNELPIQIYSDIGNEWTGQFGDGDLTTWSKSTKDKTTMFSMTPKKPAEYHEEKDMAQWGTTVFGAQDTDNAKLSVANGLRKDVRKQFFTNANGALQYTDTAWKTDSVTAVSFDMGKVKDTRSATLGIGYVRDHAINFHGTPHTGYYKYKFHGDDSNIAAFEYFLNDYSSANDESKKFDQAVVDQGKKAVSDSLQKNYTDITTLAVRQVFGATDVTIPADSLDVNKAMAWMKEISSNGNVNTMDIIRPASPILYVMAPDFIRRLLESHVQYLSTSQWNNNQNYKNTDDGKHKNSTGSFAIHDMGASYPNATGHDDGNAEQMPLDATGNLLQLAYMYQKISGNKDWAKPYQSLFKTYADYLKVNGLYPLSQLSTNDGAGDSVDQTSLAVHAAISINAYGAMFDDSTYRDAAKDHMAQIVSVSPDGKTVTGGLGIDRKHTHFTLTYRDDATWTSMFNIFFDQLLDLNTVPKAAIDMQNKYYGTIRGPGGVSIDSRGDYGSANWMLFCAATSGSDANLNIATQEMFVNDVHATLRTTAPGKTLNNEPFPDRFKVSEPRTKGAAGGAFVAGKQDRWKARPVVGGLFSLMANKGGDTFKDILSTTPP